MERMAAGVEVVDYHFNSVVIVYDLSVSSIPIDNRVCGVFANTQGCVK